jgi:hypothetical protein
LLNFIIFFFRVGVKLNFDIKKSNQNSDNKHQSGIEISPEKVGNHDQDKFHIAHRKFPIKEILFIIGVEETKFISHC